MLVKRKRSADAELQVGVSRTIVIIPDYIAFFTKEKRLRPHLGTKIPEMRTGIRWPVWSLIYSQMVPVAVANTFSFQKAAMVFGPFSFSYSLMLFRSLGISSMSNKLCDEALFTIIVAVG